MAHKIVIIGAGYSGLAAAAYLSRQGFEVGIIEKNSIPGGRARMFESGGFKFDLGPSWIWMPELFERFFQNFGRDLNDSVKLQRLDSMCRVFTEDNVPLDIPGSKSEFFSLVDQIEPQKSKKLKDLFKRSEKQYHSLKKRLIQKADNSYNYFHLFSNVIRKTSNAFKPINVDVNSFFQDERLNAALKFPLFLLSPSYNSPSNFSFIHEVMFDQGLWYPKGGMQRMVQALVSVCYDQDVDITYNVDVDQLEVLMKRVNSAHVNFRSFYGSYFLSSADYYHTDQELLGEKVSNYKSEFWNKKNNGSSALIYHIVLNKKIEGLNHINYFSRTDSFSRRNRKKSNNNLPVDPEFIVIVPTKTDPELVPDNHEIIKIIMPIPASISDTGKIREHYFNQVLEKLRRNTNQQFADSDIVFYKSYSQTDFMNDFHAHNGNVWGVTETNRLFGPFRAKIRNFKLPNLFYTGQYTFPGPGLPMALLSGEMAAAEIYHASGGRKS